MTEVVLYTREGCHLCEEVKGHLDELRASLPHKLVEIDIESSRELQVAFALEIPVVEIGVYRLKAPITRGELEMTLRAAQDRQRQIDSINRSPEHYQVTWADRFSYWLSNHYMAVFNLLVLIYVGLPFLAPVLMLQGATAPAAVIYRVYGGACHQFAFRSWFIGGEQLLYPREAAGVEGILTYGQASGLSEEDQYGARAFLGNERMGYKVGLCQRDVAIYGSILLFGLVFVATGRKIPHLPWYLWLLVGMLPIALDGFSQLISQPPFREILTGGLLQYRESSPLLRSLTGALFGLTTAWFGYPLVEETMTESRKYVAAKMAQLQGSRRPG